MKYKFKINQHVWYYINSNTCFLGYVSKRYKINGVNFYSFTSNTYGITYDNIPESELIIPDYKKRLNNAKKRIVNPVDLGKTGQEAALWFLKATVKAEDIHELASKTVRGKNGETIYTKGTPCDFICSIPIVIPGNKRLVGVASYIEVKLHDDDPLPHSVLKDKQVKDLLSWHNHGHWSFILWVYKSQVVMFKYPCPDFKKGKSISLKRAREIAWKKNYK